MQLFIFILVYPLIWVLSRFPLRVLYFFSDVLYVLTYRIIGYRKAVVRKNIKIAYPDISEEKLKTIEKKFYHHFCDLFIEMIKTMGISEAEMNKRYVFKNMDVAGQYLNNNRDMILCLGHYASYEWILSMNTYYDNNGYAIYKKIKNKYFDKMMRDIRGKWKTTLVINKEAKAKIAEVLKEKQKRAAMFGFIMDQSPSNDRNKHWAPFFSVKTPFFIGVESIAKEHNLPLVFLGVTKVKRGYYEATFTVITENPNDYKDFELTDKFANLLQKQIEIAPEFYFWTHKRFKFIKGLDED
ncbi:lysophospholipid acyltransferase family protein [Patiriisocius sp. Uisw_017]|jgi:KDO2-lipid IV(A) lauroyltransferase|uniref:lysophospholipid acyltransferase family protein n=1 Tax=Patiriisocius sp. Uisw_017 TaxID=3230968 RepID=UPI0039E7395A